MIQHLVLFDATCPFCQNAVDKVKRWDKNEIFTYAPLESPLGKHILEKDEHLKHVDSLILIERFHSPSKRVWIKGRAVLRIFWLLGGWKKCIGWLALFPFGFDVAYDIIARHRHRLKRTR